MMVQEHRRVRIEKEKQEAKEEKQKLQVSAAALFFQLTSDSAHFVSAEFHVHLDVQMPSTVLKCH